jgi:SAM-dependent methyltransferase
MERVPPPERLFDTFGGIDVYLFDQLLRGRITSAMRVLDAGCGAGRNMVYLVQAGLDVSGIDADADAVAAARTQAATLGLRDAATRIVQGTVEALPWPDAAFDAVISSAVLHFARDDAHFVAMVREMWRVLAPGGLLFCRLASSEGLAGQIRPVGQRRFVLPDGSCRFLVDAAMLAGLAARLGGVLVDPLRTSLVHEQRAMTTWVVRRP